MKFPLLKGPGKVRLSDFDTVGSGKLTAKEALPRFQAAVDTLSKLQELLWATKTHSLLVLFQGIDASGKDGTTRAIFTGVNPQGCRVTSFKAPNETEAAHDFLWRVHAACPARGEIAVFNRSHYEAVLVERVENLVEKEVWKDRYEQIVAFEHTLAASNTLILKCFLHISKAEQKERLEKRESDPTKLWKVNADDWKTRDKWRAYHEAFDDMLGKTASAEAPWLVVPADQKWYRNLVVAEALVATLKPYEKDWKRKLGAKPSRK